MDEQRHTAIFLTIIFIAMLFVVYRGRVELGGTRDQLALTQADLTQERQFSDEVFAENQQLRDANGKLRLRVVELYQNLSVEEERVKACIERLPSLEGALSGISPRHRVDVGDLLVTPDLVVVNLADVTTGIVAPTGSMVPILGAGSIVLEVMPRDTSEVFIGDIIIYELAGERIIHRVVRIGRDDEGWFAVTKGDNNAQEDPQKVRFPQVRGLVVGIIY